MQLFPNFTFSKEAFNESLDFATIQFVYQMKWVEQTV